jgi:integrase
MPPRFRAMVLLAAFASLRWGEVVALRRCDIAADASSVSISRSLVESTTHGLMIGPPKSRAGVRSLTIPTAVRAEILRHLDEYTNGAQDALVFTGEQGRPIRRPNFNQRVKWTATVAAMELKGVHFHDLRHAGNTWAAQAGHQGPHDAHGSRRHAGRDHLPTCQQRGGSGHRSRLSARIDQHRAAGAAQTPTSEGDDDGAAGALASTG